MPQIAFLADFGGQSFGLALWTGPEIGHLDPATVQQGSPPPAGPQGPPPHLPCCAPAGMPMHGVPHTQIHAVQFRRATYKYPRVYRAPSSSVGEGVGWLGLTFDRAERYLFMAFALRHLPSQWSAIKETLFCWQAQSPGPGTPPPKFQHLSAQIRGSATWPLHRGGGGRGCWTSSTRFLL